jgi:hypothetical protein
MVERVFATARGSADHPWLQKSVSNLDAWLRRQQGVFEYVWARDCIFRVAINHLDRDLDLSDGVHLRSGDRVVNLHLWNEQVPPVPAAGATIAWARQMNRGLAVSLHHLAEYLAARPALDDIKAIRANMGFGTSQQGQQLARISGRYGFEPAPKSGSVSRGAAIHRFGENVLISLMVLARSTAALRRDSLWRDRTEVFLSRQTLDERFKSGLNGRDSRPDRGP